MLSTTPTTLLDGGQVGVWKRNPRIPLQPPSPPPSPHQKPQETKQQRREVHSANFSRRSMRHARPTLRYTVSESAATLTKNVNAYKHFSSPHPTPQKLPSLQVNGYKQTFANRGEVAGVRAITRKRLPTMTRMPPGGDEIASVRAIKRKRLPTIARMSESGDQIAGARPSTRKRLPTTARTLSGKNLPPLKTMRTGDQQNVYDKESTHTLRFDGEAWEIVFQYGEDELNQAVALDVSNALHDASSASVSIHRTYEGFYVCSVVAHPAQISESYINHCLMNYHYPATRRLYQAALLQLTSSNPLLSPDHSEEDEADSIYKPQIHDAGASRKPIDNTTDNLPDDIDRKENVRKNRPHTKAYTPSGEISHIVQSPRCRREEFEEESLLSSSQSDIHVEGGRSAASRAASVLALPGDERPMTSRPLRAPPLQEAEMDGGRSVASRAASVFATQGDERPMTSGSLGAPPLQEAEMDGGRS
ncbi:hypothetical protein DQ04_10831010, partial [Trypanosoma grayi]|uniref:hypothetical protein n=1 Tax=Trypanosoma grayi TaxID=71804 RepID=UPI0004F4A13A